MSYRYYALCTSLRGSCVSYADYVCYIRDILTYWWSSLAGNSLLFRPIKFDLVVCLAVEAHCLVYCTIRSFALICAAHYSKPLSLNVHEFFPAPYCILFSLWRPSIKCPHLPPGKSNCFVPFQPMDLSYLWNRSFYQWPIRRILTYVMTLILTQGRVFGGHSRIFGESKVLQYSCRKFESYIDPLAECSLLHVDRPLSRTYRSKGPQQILRHVYLSRRH